MKNNGISKKMGGKNSRTSQQYETKTFHLTGKFPCELIKQNQKDVANQIKNTQANGYLTIIFCLFTFLYAFFLFVCAFSMATSLIGAKNESEKIK